MQSEITTLADLQTFYKKHTKPYERRYFVRYLPQYLKKFSVTDVPQWVISALDSAMGSAYSPLVVSAVKCIGELQITAFSDNLALLFIDAPQRDVAYSSSLRSAALHSLERTDHEYVKKNLQRLVKGYSEFLICDPVFADLMKTLRYHGNKTLLPQLNRFESHARKYAEKHKDNEQLYREYIRIAQMISRTSHAVVLKGANNE